jgi:hypothetical protein
MEQPPEWFRVNKSPPSEGHGSSMDHKKLVGAM